MESARCVCRVMGTALCPIHGGSPSAPALPYLLSFSDKKWLRTLRIDPEDDIADTRQADEDRFKP